METRDFENYDDLLETFESWYDMLQTYRKLFIKKLTPVLDSIHVICISFVNKYFLWKN
jgi:hypothetical protein